MFTEEYNIRDRKYQSYYDGETLFGLPHTNYPELVKVKEEITRLDKLYGLYTKVNQQNDSWKDFQWSSINDQIQQMTDSVEAFQRDMQRLPGALKEKQAFNDLKGTINDMNEIIPLIQGLSKNSIKERHWLEIMDLPQFNKEKPIPYQDENMTLKNVMDANLLQMKDDVEDICDQADKQLKLEKTLMEIIGTWDDRTLKIVTCA
jgi:dynein heavy chain